MDLTSLSSTQKSDLMDQVKQQIALANAQELLTKMTEKCFKKCVNRPGSELDSGEQKVRGASETVKAKAMNQHISFLSA
jgi:mitochondrial import inner membrane translocase subunit TIM13